MCCGVSAVFIYLCYLFIFIYVFDSEKNEVIAAKPLLSHILGGGGTPPGSAVHGGQLNRDAAGMGSLLAFPQQGGDIMGNFG